MVSTSTRTLFFIGVATVFASTCDAMMYVCVEDLLGMKCGCVGVLKSIEPAELTFAVGSIGTMFLAPVGWAYALTRYWNQTLYAPMAQAVENECAGRFGVVVGQEPSALLVLIWWTCGGLCMYLHYYSFYVVVDTTANAVVAGVAKSLQSAAVFFVNAAMYASCDQRQAVSVSKCVSAAAVIFGTALYSLCKPSANGACQAQGSMVGEPLIRC